MLQSIAATVIGLTSTIVPPNGLRVDELET
jgi:hypothetical protein